MNKNNEEQLNNIDNNFKLLFACEIGYYKNKNIIIDYIISLFINLISSISILGFFKSFNYLTYRLLEYLSIFSLFSVIQIFIKYIYFKKNFYLILKTKELGLIPIYTFVLYILFFIPAVVFSYNIMFLIFLISFYILVFLLNKTYILVYKSIRKNKGDYNE